MFGQSVLGSNYEVNGVHFQVLGIEPYPRKKISKQYKEILKFRSGVLVAIPYRGTLIPNITIRGGVVRIIKIDVYCSTYKNPKAICEALEVREAIYPYDLSKY
ncbi:MAG: hypothetical protein AAB504_03135 [Patescibacteria group bacterium]